MGFLVVLMLVSSSCLALGGLIYHLFLVLVKTKKPTADFDYIDNRNQTRFLRYHYPEDKP